MSQRKFFAAIALLLASAVSGAIIFNASAHAADGAKRSWPHNPLRVSIVQLIAHPDDYDGEYIQVMGFYRSEFEGTSVYLHKEDYEQHLYKNGLWVSRDEISADLKYAVIEGRFEAKSQGHMGLWSGTIRDVTRLEPMFHATTQTAR